MKHILPSRAFNALSAKAYKTILVLALTLSISVSSFAHRAEPFIIGCVTPGQPMNIDAYIFSAGGATMYQWQFRDNSGNWKCFVNGNNTINGVVFNVISGATGGPVADDAPLLKIASAGIALENVQVRVLMQDNALPACVNTPIGFTPTGNIYGGDDQALNETKYLRLHVFSSMTICPPNAYACANNILVQFPAVGGFAGYYGGFENINYVPATGAYTRGNFSNLDGASGANTAQTDYTRADGNGNKTFSDYNNPSNKSLNYTLARNIAPHSGNYQMIVEGVPAVDANSLTDRFWYKTVNVANGSQYRFDLWVCRIDASTPFIQLRARNATGTINLPLTTFNTTGFSIGEWKLVHGTYNATATGPITFSAKTTTAGANFSIDDICLSVCTNCAALPLHSLDLRANLTGSSVGLKFLAENEMNTNKFAIERSTDGTNYSEIGFKLPTGPLNVMTEYAYADDIQSLSGASVVYYRVKATDNENRFAYSNIATVRLNKTAGVQVWPSPFRDFVNITYNSSVNTKVEVSIVNSVGKAVKLSNYSVTRGLNQIALSGLETLSSGIYFVRITDKNTNEVYIQKISK